MCRSPDNSCAVCVQCSMKLRFEEKILYSQDPKFNCFPLKQDFNKKKRFQRKYVDILPKALNTIHSTTTNMAKTISVYISNNQNFGI